MEPQKVCKMTFPRCLVPKATPRISLVAMGLLLVTVVTDAFSTTSFVSSTLKKTVHHECSGRSDLSLSMVTQVPTSNVTLDDMMLDDDDDKTNEGGEDLSTVDTMEIKRRILDLIPRMTGEPEEYNLVESYVNILEERYTPVQTLDFLNLAMSGEWQLLFSTTLLSGPRPDIRLRDLCQKIESDGFNGTVYNEAVWEYAENHDGPMPALSYDAFGTFTIKSNYSINQGARMILDLDERLMKLSKGSAVPEDFHKLVALLNRAIPKELFSPEEHAMDTTYLDGDLRIVRMSGPKFESVRDIFIRRGSMQINPV